MVWCRGTAGRISTSHTPTLYLRRESGRCTSRPYPHTGSSATQNTIPSPWLETWHVGLLEPTRLREPVDRHDLCEEKVEGAWRRRQLHLILRERRARHRRPPQAQSGPQRRPAPARHRLCPALPPGLGGPGWRHLEGGRAAAVELHARHHQAGEPVLQLIRGRKEMVQPVRAVGDADFRGWGAAQAGIAGVGPGGPGRGGQSRRSVLAEILKSQKSQYSVSIFSNGAIYYSPTADPSKVSVLADPLSEIGHG